MMRRLTGLSVALAAAGGLVLAPASPAVGVPGDLDTTFGSAGVATVFAGGQAANSEGTAVAVDRSGNVVVGGSATPLAGGTGAAPPAVTVTRLTAAGGPDPSFGTGGSVTVPLGGYPMVRAVAAQADGSVVVAADVSVTDAQGVPTDQRAYALRLTPQGALDSSFGGGGVAQLDPSGSTSVAGLALAAGGAVTVSGSAASTLGGVPTPFVERLTSYGSPDSAFARGGIVTLSGAGSAAAVTTDSAGRVVVGVVTDSWMTADPAAETLPGLVSSFTLRRLTAAGVVDTAFGQGGAAAPGLPPATTVRTLLAEPDGSTVAVGGLGGHPLVARFTAAGAPDAAFGHGGVVDVSLPGGAHTDDLGAALLADGDILVGGPGGPTGVFLVRLLPTGAPDRSFAAGGRAAPLISTTPPVITQTGPAPQADGSVDLAGRSPGVPLPDGTIDGDQLAVFRLLGGSGAVVPAPNTATRLGGPDRIGTAIAASRATFTEAGRPEKDRLGAGGVLLAGAEDFADALVAVPYAAYIHAPVLLTARGGLDPRVLAEIQRVLGDPARGTRVTIVGGPAAVGAGVEEAVRAAGYDVERIAGSDRYETAARMAEQTGAGVVLETTGLDFADAVAAGAAAAHLSGAVLLTAGRAQTGATASYLRSSGAVRYAVGGPAATADPTAIPLVGADRYATAAKLAATFFPTPAAAEVATGATFPDALSAGWRAAVVGGPVLLTGSSVLPQPTADWLQGSAGWVDAADVLGGTAAVDDTVLAAVQRAIS